MKTALVTFILTFAIIFIALCMLGISWLLTGKSRLRVGMCGRTPTQKRDAKNGCGKDITCGLCGRDGKDEFE